MTTPVLDVLSDSMTTAEMLDFVEGEYEHPPVAPHHIEYIASAGTLFVVVIADTLSYTVERLRLLCGYMTLHEAEVTRVIRNDDLSTLVVTRGRAFLHPSPLAEATIPAKWGRASLRRLHPEDFEVEVTYDTMGRKHYRLIER